jgi:L-fuculose-phosphate aldolase
MSSETRARAALALAAQGLHARGWVANHEGNGTLRLAPGRILATPTAVSKAAITAESLLVLDDDGRVVSGRGKPFSEIGLHLAVLAARPDVQAVLHAHPPTATGFAVAGIPLDRPILAEAVVSLGPSIPTVPFAAPGAAAAGALRPFLATCDVCLLESHGALAWGTDVDQALLRLEHVEHLARILLVARQLGGAKELPPSVLPSLLEARRKAFPHATAAEPASPRPVAPHHGPELRRIIAEELAEVLRRS